jgi:hypothetical protein
MMFIEKNALYFTNHKEHPPEVWLIPPGTPCIK